MIYSCITVVARVLIKDVPIKDVPTGLMGFVNIPYAEASTASVKDPQEPATGTNPNIFPCVVGCS
jgi:hypothetical protein